MNKKEIVALKEKAMKLIVDARALAQKATNEKRAMNAEENVTFDKMFADASSLKEQAKRGEELLSLEDGLSTEPGRRTEEPAGKETA
jgi:hypothetical protein